MSTDQKQRRVGWVAVLGLLVIVAGWLAFTQLGDRRSRDPDEEPSRPEGPPASNAQAADDPVEAEVRAPEIPAEPVTATEMPSEGTRAEPRPPERETVANSPRPSSDDSAPNARSPSREAVPAERRVDSPPPGPPAAESAPPDAGHPSADEEQRRSQRQRRYIQAAFNNLREGVRECYLELLDEYPDATDRLVVVVEFVAEESDQAIAEGQLMAIESTDWEVDDLTCFADVFDGISIPLVEGMEAGETTVIRYPFQFTAEP